MPQWRPDQTFYPSPAHGDGGAPGDARLRGAAQPDAEGRPDAMGVVDVNPRSKHYGSSSARSTCRTPATSCTTSAGTRAARACARTAPHPHVERRYLVVPGLRSSRIHILDTKPDPRQPRIVKVIEAGDDRAHTGYARPHTVHCGPDGIYLNALGAPDGDGPGGIFMLDPRDLRGEGPLGDGPRPAAPVLRLLVAPRPRHDDHQRVGHAEHGRRTASTPSCCWPASTATSCTCGTCKRRRHVKALDLGAEQQMVLELRPAHDPAKAYGFVGVVVIAQGPVGVGLGLVSHRRERQVATGRSRR